MIVLPYAIQLLKENKFVKIGSRTAKLLKRKFSYKIDFM